MGFFDFFSGGEDSQLKHIKRLTNLTPQEERLLSAQWLAEKGTPEALSVTKRFSLVYEKLMKDLEEDLWLLRSRVRLLLNQRRVGSETIRLCYR